MFHNPRLELRIIGKLFFRSRQRVIESSCILRQRNIDPHEEIPHLYLASSGLENQNLIDTIEIQLF